MRAIRPQQQGSGHATPTVAGMRPDREIMNTPGRSTGVRRRRRLDVVLLVLAAVVGVLPASVAAAFGGERGCGCGQRRRSPTTAAPGSRG